LAFYEPCPPDLCRFNGFLNPILCTKERKSETYGRSGLSGRFFSERDLTRACKKRS
jgi:hypothetical protein